MKRRSQGRTSIAKEPSPAPQASSPVNSKREAPGDGEPIDVVDTPAKRQRIDSAPSTSAKNGDRTLVQEEKADVDAALSPLTANEEPDSHPSPKSMRSPSPDELAPMRHERFWYDDGSVVLQVRRVLFRLHKSSLNTQSSYFRDLFADPYRPPEQYNVGSGVSLPLYVLSLEGLRVFDFEQLLEALENPHAITRKMDSPPLDTLYAIARASHVLKFERTHAWAKDELLDYWPSELKRVQDQPQPDSHCVQAAMLALECSVNASIPEIRKHAFYELLRLPDLGQRDETVPLMLSHDDHNSLVSARQYCAMVWMDILLAPPPRCEPCVEYEKKKGKASCAAQNDILLKGRWLIFVGVENLRKYSIDPVAGFKALQKIHLPKQSEGGYCAECRASWRDIWKTKVVQFWEGLDKALDLIPTEETVEVE